MAIYPGNPAVVLEEAATASNTSSALTRITLGSHTGTHIDGLSHITKGAAGTGSYALEPFIGEAQVIAVDAETITAAILPKTAVERVLIKTKNSAVDINTFDPDFVALDESAAQELVNRGIKLIGIDGPSIKKKGVRDRTHAILLDAGIVIIESLWLNTVEIGSYELICLPLAVDLDGAPARVVLRSTK
ncbi:MAG: cyclase family protein [Candidatus Andersenbacteria bacterium]|nr:cyclase family protein [Candidatus Andersenbacteria bacterium]